MRNKLLNTSHPGPTNLIYIYDRLNMLAKMRTATISFVMSIHLSAWNNLAPTGQIIMKYFIEVFLENMAGKFQFH